MEEQLNQQENIETTSGDIQQPTKFCKHCGAKILQDAVICTACGRQVEELRQSSSAQPNIVINNANNNVNSNSNINNNAVGIIGRPKNKWVALLLCIFLEVFGGHKFYEGKIGMGILYLLTCGLFGIGVFIDFLTILFKPTTYYVM